MQQALLRLVEGGFPPLRDASEAALEGDDHAQLEDLAHLLHRIDDFGGIAELEDMTGVDLHKPLGIDEHTRQMMHAKRHSLDGLPASANGEAVD